MNISDCISKGRTANNFNLLRFIAALAVIYTHSFALSGQGGLDFFQQTSLQMGASFIAVEVFFVISGFLICASAQNNSTLNFILGRVFRLFPALIIAMLFCILLGLYFSSLTSYDYLTNPQTKKFFLHNAFLVPPLQILLPGEVFATNPLKYTLNGSLWTLPWELRSYFLLLGLFVLSSFFSIKTKNKNNLFFVLCTITFVVCLLAFFSNKLIFHSNHELLTQGVKLIALFFLGATYYQLKEKIQLKHSYFIVISVFLWLLAKYTNHQLFSLFYLLLLPYWILYLAYIPAGFIRRFNQLGDYSYGLYIYAFPVQQAIVSFTYENASKNFYIATLLTLILAVLSWYLIEQPSLKARKKIGYKITSFFTQKRKSH